MNYSPQHNDVKMKGIYFSLIAIGLSLNLAGSGVVKTILSSLSLILLSTGLFLFIKHGMTTYTYIAMENGNRIDFYINRTVGKRGAYVCYYPLSDLVAAEKYEKGIKSKVKEEHGKVFFYNYCHNLFSKEKQILVFQNDGYCDAVIVELSQECFKYVQDAYKKEWVVQ